VSTVVFARPASIRWTYFNDTRATRSANSRTVNRDDLLRAAKAQKVLPIYVGDQTRNQLMYVNVSVTMESGSRLTTTACNAP
jgi:hypothetical protein